MRVWRYVITVDRGGAPNFEPPMATLTLCKPRIREKAKCGELVLAFNGSSLNPYEPHSVRWAGIVSELVPMSKYWDDRRFIAKRPELYGGKRAGGLADNIYVTTPEGRLTQVKNETHVPADTERDVGGINVLVFQQVWYFGSTAPVIPREFNLRIENGRRAHRISEISEDEWCELAAWLNKNDASKNKSCVSISHVNRPLDPDSSMSRSHWQRVSGAVAPKPRRC